MKLFSSTFALLTTLLLTLLTSLASAQVVQVARGSEAVVRGSGQSSTAEGATLIAFQQCVNFGGLANQCLKNMTSAKTVLTYQRHRRETFAVRVRAAGNYYLVVESYSDRKDHADALAYSECMKHGGSDSECNRIQTRWSERPTEVKWYHSMTGSYRQPRD